MEMLSVLQVRRKTALKYAMVPSLNTENKIVCFLVTAFMAPEVITCTGLQAKPASDIWSLACVVIEMATGKVRNISNTVHLCFRLRC